MTSMELPTPYGPARVELHCAPEGNAALLLGHGAGGGIQAPDLVAATRAATAVGVHVVLVEQPYRVAGRRAPAPRAHLDAAWLAVVENLNNSWCAGLPLLFGGRSAGARVACRTASQGQAVAVLCLAFPVHPPGRPEKTRMSELTVVSVPTLVIQGARDPYGQPTAGPHRELVIVPGDHNLKSDVDSVYRAVAEWLPRIVRPLD